MNPGADILHSVLFLSRRRYRKCIQVSIQSSTCETRRHQKQSLDDPPSGSPS